MTVREFLTGLLLWGLEKYGRYYSCYRAFVVDNQDPTNMGKLLIHIPLATGLKVIPTWAYPKGVLLGKGYGLNILPTVGSMVWVEFEFGDLTKPVWSYGYNAKGENPIDFNNPNNFTFISPKSNKIILDDTDENVSIQSTGGSTITIDDKNGEIRVTLKDGSSIKLNKQEIILNTGKNGSGLVIVDKLVNELNTLQTNYNSLLASFISHVHTPPVAPSPNTSMPVIPPTSTPVNLTTALIIENNSIKH